MSLSWLLKEPEREAYTLLRNRDSISGEEILRLGFGEFPLRGIECTDAEHLKSTVAIKPMSEISRGIGNKFRLFLTTAAFSRRTNTIHHRVSRYSIPKQLIAHTAPILFGAALFLLAEAVGYPILLALLPVIWSSGRHDAAAQFLFRSFNLRNFPQVQSLADKIQHEGFHFIQGDRVPAWAPFLSVAYSNIPLWKDIIAVSDNVFGLSAPGNYTKDREVQARLHVKLTHGYKRWGRLPANETELWAALIDSGLFAPRHIKEKVAKAAAENSEVKRFLKSPKLFRLASALVCDSTAGLNVANAHYTKLGLRDYFWDIAMPYFYGQMLELYGDKQGKRKMDFEPELKPETNAWHYFRYQPSPFPQPPRIEPPTLKI